ncbi:MAG: hypothetical protein JKY54_11535 [Flavobacteriales bacterium]|nr:hypothetical protein [Flavobacteriales bacterium]
MKRTSTLKELTEFVKQEGNLRSEILGDLPQQVRKPRASVIDSILGYSKALRIEKSEMIGQLELVLN